MLPKETRQLFHPLKHLGKRRIVLVENMKGECQSKKTQMKSKCRFCQGRTFLVVIKHQELNTSRHQKVLFSGDIKSHSHLRKRKTGTSDQSCSRQVLLDDKAAPLPRQSPACWKHFCSIIEITKFGYQTFQDHQTYQDYQTHHNHWLPLRYHLIRMARTWASTSDVCLMLPTLRSGQEQLQHWMRISKPE